MAKSKQAVKKDRVNHEQLGQMLQNIYESGYINRNTMYKMSFLKGVVGGLGGVVGATILLGLLLWILSLFDETPLVGPLFDNIQQTIESKKQ
jgi:tetrahydromethanopterin S-methyltransferase subunit D